MLNVTYQGTAFDAASVHFVPTIRRTDILFAVQNSPLTKNSKLHLVLCFLEL